MISPEPAEQDALAREVNAMLQRQDMHITQHGDGLLFGPIPETDTWGIYNQSLLFANKRSKQAARRYATVYMTLQAYDEKDSERYGWTIPHSRAAAFIPSIKHGPLYTGTPRAFNLTQVEQNLLHLRQKIWDLIRDGLKMTPRQDSLTAYFALQMVSSATDTDWHIPSLNMQPQLRHYLLAGVQAPLIFAALAIPKHGTHNYRTQGGDIEIGEPRISVAEAQAMKDMSLGLVFDMLQIHLFDPA